MLRRPHEPVDEHQKSTAPQGDSDGEVPDATGAYFTSTQMQLRHEALEAKEQEAARKSAKISSLQAFSNNMDAEAAVAYKEPKKPTKKDTVKRKVQTKKTKPKSKSMNSLVRQAFDGSELSYFSGNQRKIDHFVKNVKKEDDVGKLDNASSASLFNKEEWSSVVKGLKIKFPNLLRSGKKTLKAINRRVHDIGGGNEANNSPMWSRASSHPEGALSSEDYRWLYDMDEHQMANTMSFSDCGPEDTSNSFILTLSQTASVSKPAITSDVNGMHSQPDYHAEDALNEGNCFPGRREICDKVNIELSQPEYGAEAQNDGDKEASLGTEISTANLSSGRSTPKAEAINEINRIYSDECTPQHEYAQADDIESESHCADKFTINKEHKVEINLENDTEHEDTQKHKNHVEKTNALLTQKERDEEVLRQSRLLFNPSAEALERRPKEKKVFASEIDVISDSDPEADSIIIAEARAKREEPITSRQQVATPYEIDLSDSLDFGETPYTRPPKQKTHNVDIAVDSVPWLTEGSHHSPKIIPSTPPPQTPPRNITVLDDDDLIITSVERPRPTAENALARSQFDGDEVFCTAPTHRSPTVNSSKHKISRQDDSPSVMATPTGKGNAKRRKTLQTSMYETNVSAFSDIYVNKDLGIRMRKVGTRLDPINLDYEVPDSDADSGDGIISVYEITREIAQENEPEAVNRESAHIEAVSFLQVPSSPLVIADGILDLLPTSSSPCSPLESQKDIAGTEPGPHPACLSQLSQLTTKQLKQTLVEWGLKPLRGREKMLQALESTQKLVQSSQTENHVESTQRTREAIFEAISKLIKLNWTLHEKIVSFEPLRIAELQQWLSGQGHKLELNLLEQYCDELGICCTNQA